MLVILMFASTGFSAGLSAGRILPKGTVSLFQGHQKVGEFTSEAPLPQDTLMSVQGECGVKLKDLYLVAVDKSLFSVATNTDSKKLTVKSGTVYFALSALPRTLVFQTPSGVITTHEVMIKAASNGQSIKGYVLVEEGVTRVGVLEGGAMVMMVDDGKPITIDSGRELRLAQAEIFKEDTEEGKVEEGTPEGAPEGAPEGTPAEETGAAVSTGGVSTTTAVVAGVVLVGVGIGLAAGGGGGGDSGSPASP